MGILGFNYDDVERPPPIPEGDYLMEATEVDDTGVGKKSGRGYTKISLTIVDEGDSFGRKASYFMSHPMTEDKDTEYEDETTKWGLMHRMMDDCFAAFGIPRKKGDKYDTSKFIGKSTVATIEHEINEDTGDIRWNLSKIRAA